MGDQMNLRISLVGALFALAVGVTGANAATVAGNASTPTLIAVLLPGQTYEVTATGIVDLSDPSDLFFTADGKPTYQFGGNFAGFYPNGADNDVSGGSGSPGYGPGGAGRLFGSLLGTFNPFANSPSDYFILGLDAFVTSATGATLYGLVNDSVFSDNSGSFTVTVSAVTTPVPGPLAGAGIVPLLGLGFVALRRRKKLAA